MSEQRVCREDDEEKDITVFKVGDEDICSIDCNTFGFNLRGPLLVIVILKENPKKFEGT